MFICPQTLRQYFPTIYRILQTVDVTSYEYDRVYNWAQFAHIDYIAVIRGISSGHPIPQHLIEQFHAAHVEACKQVKEQKGAEATVDDLVRLLVSRRNG